MNDFLTDTDILIDHLRGRREALDLLESATESDAIVYCSTITKIEIYAGIRVGEEDQTEALLGSLESLSVDDEIALSAGAYLNRYSKSHGLEIGDAIIAATARAMEVPLYTRNQRHYPMADVEVVVPY